MVLDESLNVQSFKSAKMVSVWSRDPAGSVNNYSDPIDFAHAQ
jgi:hypothetical protein